MGSLVTGFTLLSIGGALAVVMLVVMRMRRGEVASAERIARTPTVPIADAQGGGVVEITGTVQAGPDGLVRSPLSGREAAIYRIDVYARGSKNVHHVHTERERKSFYLDDGSGQRALLYPEQAALIGSYRRYGQDAVQAAVVIGDVPSERQALTAEQAAWILARTGRDPLRGAVYADERTIAPGDRLYALGPAVKELGPGGTWQLVMRNQGRDDAGELVMSDLKEEALLAVMNTRRKARRVILLVGLGMSALGLLLMAWGARSLLVLFE